MQAIASLARQLIDGHRGPAKLTGFYAVLQTSTGVDGDSAKNIIIDCYGAGRSVEEKAMIMGEWRQRRAGIDGGGGSYGQGARRKEPATPSALADKDAERSGSDDKNDQDGDAASGSSVAGEDDAYPIMTMNDPNVVPLLSTIQMGSKTLKQAELNLLLSMCGLRTYKQLTYNLVRGVFRLGFQALKAQGVRKGSFSWALATPPELLFNMWSLEGATVKADGGCFFAPGHTNARHQGGIDKKRFALCVAAHLCPFWSFTLRMYFIDNPINKVAVSKRFRGADDAFGKATRKRGRQNGGFKLNNGNKDPTEDADGDHPPKLPSPPKPPAADGPLPLTTGTIIELARATEVYPISDLLLVDPSPVLPTSTCISIVSLTADEFERMQRAEAELRVLLPRNLLKEAFRILGTAGSSGSAGCSVDVDPPQAPSASAGDAPSGSSTAAGGSAVGRQPALCITVGKHAPMMCSTPTLVTMSGVHYLNQQLVLCPAFESWVKELTESTAKFPWELEFLVGSTLSVAAAADYVWASCSERRVGDSAWRYFLLGAGSIGDVVGSRLYGGCTVAFYDVVYGGQRKYMTNGVLDAALVEMRLHSAVRMHPSFVLMTGQSASFTVCNGQVVGEAVAIDRIKEIYDAMPNARYQRFVMLLNLGQHHWISAEVVPGAPVGKINVFDSLAGGYPKEKDLAVSRVKLFAREVDRLWRLGNSGAPVVERWDVSFINSPSQGDGYNCGPFALAHLWCAVNGHVLGEISGLVGDHLRLAILLTLLQCGKRYDDARQRELALAGNGAGAKI
ncbi:hypothetical protein BU14_0267s0008 [Porphyra umbilicalis]|uniref:Ubiquitin-like protease family profile domain-containing protein n=1 Tax=Porphyra umbilicalis TaxID=2786 RepID=A0A1X6P1W4_PORUM|nr:hypothetical protein BU14_0267s0008 [Porphyra umbilicalis]|eukprot:OSX74807.1 hypothetical protein BU14_0267s0008 [Porphyra umbilicalis]